MDFSVAFAAALKQVNYTLKHSNNYYTLFGNHVPAKLTLILRHARNLHFNTGQIKYFHIYSHYVIDCRLIGYKFQGQFSGTKSRNKESISL